MGSGGGPWSSAAPGLQGTWWCLRRQAARAFNDSGVRGGIEGSWPPIVRMHVWKASPRDPYHSSPPTLHARVGERSGCSRLRPGCGPTLLVFLAFMARVVGHLLLRCGCSDGGVGWVMACHQPFTLGWWCVETPHARASLSLRGCLGAVCFASCVADGRVLTAHLPASAGLVGHLLLRDVRCGRVGRGAGAITICPGSQAGGSFGAPGSVGGLGSTQIQAEPGESHGGGATSLPTVKYPVSCI